MSPDHRDGVPRATLRLAALPGTTSPKETWPGANQAKDEKLRLRSLQRRAREGGYELRHSDYGYALVDAGRKSVDGRHDMSLREIASFLDGTRKA